MHPLINIQSEDFPKCTVFHEFYAYSTSVRRVQVGVTVYPLPLFYIKKFLKKYNKAKQNGLYMYVCLNVMCIHVDNVYQHLWICTVQLLFNPFAPPPLWKVLYRVLMQLFTMNAIELDLDLYMEYDMDFTM